MNLTLRDYQVELVNQLRHAYKIGYRAPLLQLSTGSGKTVIYSYIAERSAAKGKRILILVHRRELLMQNSDLLDSMAVPHGIIAPGFSPTANKVQVGSVQTVRNRLDKMMSPDLIIVDECHHTVAGSWKKIIAHYPKALLLGVTATPCRLDGRGLGKESGGYYDTLVQGPPMKALIEQGYLSACRIYAPPNGIDHSKFHIKYGDYDKHEVEAAMDNPTIVGDAIAHYKKYSLDKPAIAFCVSIDAADKLAQRFNKEGIAAECIHGDCDNMFRKYCTNGLADGRIKVLTSCEIVSEGVDIPVVTTAILLRPTKSTGLFMQQVGRIMRPHHGKRHSIILDHVGNVYLHGVPDAERYWTLEGSEHLERKKGDPKTFWQCKYCYAINDLRRYSCVSCGEVKETADRMIPEIDGELQELEQERMKEEYERQVRRDARREQGKAKTLEELEEVARRKRYRPGWARIIYNARLMKQKTT
jgi:superfamily II DNA or RNA helicase